MRQGVPLLRGKLPEDGGMTNKEHEMGRGHYGNLAIMTLVSFIAMFILMYAMVDRFADVYPNINQAYMAGLMAAPMVLIELAVMRSMYPDMRMNLAFAGIAALALMLFFVGIRAQTAVGNVQFVKSMIPHHSGALLMCGQASITDAELKKLCTEIIEGQQKEIDQMKAILARLDR
jgi:hypothetical protein